MPNPRVAVILASYNGARFICSQVDSILNQVGVHVDVYVFDDASSDDTSILLGEMQKARGNIFLKVRDVGTGSAAGNFIKAICQSNFESYDYVALSDQDDSWFPDKLDRSIAEAERVGADLVSTACLAVWNNGREKVLRQSTRIRDFDFLFEGAGQGCTFLMVQNFYSEVRALMNSHSKYFERVHYHDWAIYLICRVLGRRWAFLNEPTMYYVQHQSNDTGARGSASGAIRRLRAISSGWYSGQISSMLAIAKIISPRDRSFLEFERLCGCRQISFIGRVKWVVFLLSNSRRRFVDRVVLGGAAVLGFFK